MKRATVTLLGVFAGSGAILFAQRDSQGPVFHAATDVVTIEVSVRLGRAPVTGLTAGDFELVDNRVPQRIELVATSSMPIDVSLVLDRSHATVTPRSYSDADLPKMAALLRPTDRLLVVAFAQYVQELMTASPPNRWTAQLRSPDESPVHTVRMFDATLLALARQQERDRRHLIVAFVVDMDIGSVVDGSLLANVASRTDATLHVVAPFWKRWADAVAIRSLPAYSCA